MVRSAKARVNPDVIFTHRRDDAHQDHRQVCRLTWNTFRDHCILEYEIPKWDGDMGQPNLYVPVSAATLQRKIDLLNSHFGSQRSKQWFDAETFLGLARLRGMECRAPERYAEAFLRGSLWPFDARTIHWVLQRTQKQDCLSTASAKHKTDSEMPVPLPDEV